MSHPLTALFSLMILTPCIAGAGQAIDPFPVDKVAAHTYVIHGPLEQPNPGNKGFMNNPAFVVTDSGVIVVDPGSSVHIGRMVLKQIRTVTDKPVTHVFDTHVHGDHWLGNHAIQEAFPQAKFYAHPKMIERAHGGAADQWIELMERLTEGATRGTKAVIPAQAVADGQEFKIDGITLRVHIVEAAHSHTDAMFEIVEDSLLFTGDNVTYRRIPRMDDGTYRGNIAACERALELGRKTYVPGHGSTGDAAIVDAYRNYLSTLYEAVAELYEEGLEAFEMKEAVRAKLETYESWPGFDQELGKHISLAVLEIEQAEFE